MELIDEKREEGAVSHDTSDGDEGSNGRGKVVDLMDALKKSVNKDKGGTKKKAASRSTKSKSKSGKAA